MEEEGTSSVPFIPTSFAVVSSARSASSGGAVAVAAAKRSARGLCLQLQPIGLQDLEEAPERKLRLEASKRLLNEVQPSVDRSVRQLAAEKQRASAAIHTPVPAPKKRGKRSAETPASARPTKKQST